MKKITMKLSSDYDESEIHSEAHKIRRGKGNKLKNKGFVDADEKELKIKIKPKCSK